MLSGGIAEAKLVGMYKNFSDQTLNQISDQMIRLSSTSGGVVCSASSQLLLLEASRPLSAGAAVYSEIGIQSGCSHYVVCRAVLVVLCR